MDGCCGFAFAHLGFQRGQAPASNSQPCGRGRNSPPPSAPRARWCRPSRHRRRRHRPSPDSALTGTTRAFSRPACFSCKRRSPQGRAGSGISAVGEDEKADAGVRKHQHRRAIAGIAAIVRDRPGQVAVIHHIERHAVGLGLAAGRGPLVAGPRHAQGKIRTLGQFAHGLARHRAVVGIAARRPGRQKIGDPFGIIIGAGLQTADGSESAFAQIGLARELRRSRSDSRWHGARWASGRC